MRISILWPTMGRRRAKKTAALVLASVLLGILAVWSITVFLVLDKRQSLVEERRQVLGRVNGVVSLQVQNYFKVIEVFLGNADQWSAKNPESDLRLDDDFAHMLAAFRERTKQQIDIRLYDENGGIYYPQSKSDAPLGNVAQNDFFLAASAQKEGGIFIGAPFLTPVLKRWVVPISLPLRSKPHGMAVIAGIVSLHTFGELFENTRDKPNGSITLLRQDGTLMARAPLLENMIGKSIPTGSLISTLIKEKPRGDIIAAGDAESGESLLSYAAIQDYPMVTVVAADMEDILLPSREYAAYACLVALTLTLLMIVVAIQALTHLRLVEENHVKILSEAPTDALTNVANRRSLLRFAGNEVVRAQRYERPLSLLMLDLDRFREVNDQFGSQWGDEILKQVAMAIQGILRGTDFLGRYGGEEFAVIMPETSTAEAASLAQRIREGVGQILLDTGNDKISIKVSIGVATLAPEDPDAQALINRSEAAVYSAKRAGRNCVVCAPDPRPTGQYDLI